MSRSVRFIVIDDDVINNMLCSIVLGKIEPGSEIETFNIPEQGFAFIQQSSVYDFINILFLDINMPSWSGWEFLEHFDTLDETIRRQVKIYILSSSIDPNDYKRAMENKHVTDYIVKPLTEKLISDILGNQFFGLAK